MRPIRLAALALIVAALAPAAASSSAPPWSPSRSRGWPPWWSAPSSWSGSP